MGKINYEIALLCLFGVWLFVAHATASTTVYSQVTTTTRVNKYISAEKMIWKRIKAKENTFEYAQKYCGKKQVNIVELGLIEGQTKLVRFICE